MSSCVCLVIYDLTVYLVLSVQFDFVWSTRYSRCFLSALSCLVCIKDYYLSLRPHLRVLVPPCCVHRDRRPDLNVKAPLDLVLFCTFFLVFICFLCFVSRGKRVRWPRALMRVDRGRYPPPAVAIPSPPAGSLVSGLPLPQARRSLEITPPARL